MLCGLMKTKDNIYGIDFSGAKDAGKKIWIAEGTIAKGTLLIQDCIGGNGLPGSGNKLEMCLPALRSFVKKHSDAAFGMDFPFGLPKSLVKEDSWKDFILKFPSLYSSPEEFQEKCTSRALEISLGQRKELKRETDDKARTPFSPYNLKIFKQTYYGISELLYPLVSGELVCVLPMQEPDVGKPWLLEICPASTLKHLNFYRFQYKGRYERHREARRQLLKRVMRVGPVRLGRGDLSDIVIDDPGGDALDSIIAALATYQALKTMVLYPIEGYVYV